MHAFAQSHIYLLCYNSNLLEQRCIYYQPQCIIEHLTAKQIS